MFANKVVIVTGSSAGIGAVTAEYFAKEGASVTIVGRNEDKLKSVAARCEKLGAKVLAIKADISKENEAKTIVKQTVDKFGKLDVLVNNAGIVRIARIDSDESNVLAVYDEVMNTNTRSVVQITNLATPHLKASKGNIVNVSSISAMKLPMPGMSAYSMSKAAMDHFTRATAIELAPFGIRVNSINPGPVMTDIVGTFAHTIPQDIVAKLSPEHTTLLNRMSESGEIADIILYVASDKARGITGSCYVIDNGMLLK